MAKFIYKGITSSGKKKSGSVSAATKDDAVSQLKNQGLSSLKVNKDLFGNISFKINLGKAVTTKDLKTFTRQFATMIDAGLPLVQCLEILGTQSENKLFGNKLLGIKAHVEGGLTFSDALAKEPKIFDELFVALVAAGELGGILDSIMRRLAEYIEKRERLQRKVKSAMTYPFTILVVAVGVIIVLLTQVIPQFEQMFADFGDKELPALTQLVIRMSEKFIEYWYFVFIAVVIIIIAYSTFYKSVYGKKVMHRFFLWLPGIGIVIRKIAVARFTRTMGTLLSSGVPIIEALNTVSKAAGNVVVEKAILYARDRISEGRNMSDPLKESGVFPGMVTQMIAVGEQTGALDVMCNKIADFYDEEVDLAVAAMTSMLEPIMIVLIASVVGTIIIAMYLPVFEIAGAVND